MSSPDADRNLVLAALPQSDREALLPMLASIALEPGAELHHFGSSTDHYIFPLSGMISLTVPTPTGDNVEVALVGREGMFGIAKLVADSETDLQAIAQAKGQALAIPTAQVAAETRAALRTASGPYNAALLIELAQTAACNRLHSVEERTARWLLHAADRAQTVDLKLTHEFLAMMLGVRRASVTVVVGAFEAAGLIVAERGRISLADPKGLRGYACTCYEVIRQATATARN